MAVFLATLAALALAEEQHFCNPAQSHQENTPTLSPCFDGRTSKVLVENPTEAPEWLAWARGIPDGQCRQHALEFLCGVEYPECTSDTEYELPCRSACLRADCAIQYDPPAALAHHFDCEDPNSAKQDCEIAPIIFSSWRVSGVLAAASAVALTVLISGLAVLLAFIVCRARSSAVDSRGRQRLPNEAPEDEVDHPDAGVELPAHEADDEKAKLVA